MILGGMLIALASPVPAVPASLHATLAHLAEGRKAQGGAVDAFDEARAVAVVGLIDQLEELAAWCKRKRLLLERDKVLEAILEYDADHADARSELGYDQRSNGTWYRKKPYRPPRDYDAKALPEAAEKRREASAGYRQAILDLLDEHAETLASARRDEELRKLLVLDPEDEDVRARLGQVALGQGVEKRWVLPESRTALETRKRMAELKTEAFASVPEPERFEAEGSDTELGVTFAHGVRTDRASALASTTLEEAQRAVRMMHAAPGYLGAVLGVGTGGRMDMRAYLMDANQKNTFISHYPALDDARRELLKQLAGGWLGSSRRIAEWSATPDNRIDSLTRQIVGAYFQDTWGIGTQHGWAWEGLGIYLSHQLCGTRLTFFVRQTVYTGDSINLTSRLSGSDANWLDEARRLLGGERPPNLAFALGKDVNQLDADDMLVSHALAAFLVEAHIDKLGEIMRKIGKGEVSSVVALEEAFGEDLNWLQARLLAWLEEVARS